MTKKEVKAAGGKCSNYKSCRAENGKLVMGLQRHAASNLLWLARYRFTSRSETDEMIKKVSEEYGLPPKTTGEPHWPKPHKKVLYSGMLLGTPAANWELGDGSSLSLYLHGGHGLFDYELQLQSPTLEELDHEAMWEAEEAAKAKRRAINH